MPLQIHDILSITRLTEKVKRYSIYIYLKQKKRYEKWLTSKLTKNSKLTKKIITGANCTGSQFIMNMWEQKLFKTIMQKGWIAFHHCRPRRINNILLSPIMITKTGYDTATVFAGDAGFFSLVKFSINGAYVCTLLGLLPHFEWVNHSYGDSTKGANAYEYFFKQPDTLPLLPDHVPYPELLQPIVHLTTPNTKEDRYIPLPPPDTNGITTLIIKHFYTKLLRPNILSRDSGICIDGCIGVHVRSGYQNRNVYYLMKEESEGKACQFVNGIPFDAYLEAINKAFDHPDVTSDKVFLATDSEQIAEMFIKAMPDQIILSPATRHELGEMHVHRVASGYQMGLEVIQDVDLLSRCAYLVHGSSNITNFLQCMRPDQPRTDIGKAFYPDLASL